MNRYARPLVLVALLASTASLFAGDSEQKKDVPPALDFEMKTIDGEPVHLSEYHGDVVLMVNTASECGYTPQYAGLQKLHEKYNERGLSVLAFPANNFGGQEPGDNEQIQRFCKTNYGVTFDLFAKVSVKGKDQCELYRYLTGEETNPDFAGPVKWNFEKFLLNREGEVIARFRSKAKPTGERMVEAIEQALAEKPE